MTVNTNRAQRLQKLKRKHARRILFITFICLTLAGTTILLAFGSRPGSSAGAGPSSTPAVTPTAPIPSLSSGLPVITSSPSAGKKPYISPAPSVIATPAVTPAGSFNRLVNPAGSTIRTRFAVPKGWERVETAQGSFAEYLRELPLKADGKPLLYWDGKPNDNPAHAAVLDRPMPQRYEQCADTVIHLYADWLYSTKQYDKLRFTFNNGFVCDFEHYMQGYRPNDAVTGWKTQDDYWTGDSRRVYDLYLQQTFLYANTASLFKYDLDKVEYADLSIGDLFIVPGFPGHVVIVADMIVNKTTGEKRFITVQGSMPAVQAHIMLNAEEPEFSPWQSCEIYDGYFVSATYWGCPLENIRRFR